MYSPCSPTQREALVNCTNLTTEPTYNNPKSPTPPVHALFKRSRPVDDGSARLKRLKFSVGESRTGEDVRGYSSDESEEEDSDGSSITYCTPRRKRTIFQAKNALAMSRPGVTCRPLPCKPGSLVISTVIDSHSADPLTPPCLCILSQDRRVHVQFRQGGLILNTTICLRIHQWYVSLMGT